VVGDIMVNCTKNNLRKIKKSGILQKIGIESKKFFLITLHRQSNVDSRKKLEKILQIIKKLEKEKKVVFPVHPRTMKNLKKFNLFQNLKLLKNTIILKPLGYVDFAKLLSEAGAVLTDSGGVQIEANFLNTPCIILRENTERNFLLKSKNTALAGPDSEKIFKKAMVFIKMGKHGRKFSAGKKLFDGKTGKRIVKIIFRKLELG